METINEILTKNNCKAVFQNGRVNILSNDEAYEAEIETLKNDADFLKAQELQQESMALMAEMGKKEQALMEKFGIKQSSDEVNAYLEENGLKFALKTITEAVTELGVDKR